MKPLITLWHVSLGCLLLGFFCLQNLFFLILWLLLTGLLVVSSKDKEPISKFADLFNANQLPPLLNEGIMDPQILKHYLVLHEQQDGPQEMYYSILLIIGNALSSLHWWMNYWEMLTSNTCIPKYRHILTVQILALIINLIQYVVNSYKITIIRMSFQIYESNGVNFV